MEETDQKIREFFQNAYDRFAPDHDGRKALVQAASRIQARSKSLRSTPDKAILPHAGKQKTAHETT